MLQKLQNNLKLYQGKLQPASPKQVLDLEIKLNRKLPLVLKEFFLLVGGDYDTLWGGGGGDKLSKINFTLDLSKELLNETSVILEDYFPFSSYNDDQFLFVYYKDGDNPPVYKFELELYYCGDDYMPSSSSWNYPKGVSKIADSFSNMIEDIINYKIAN